MKKNLLALSLGISAILLSAQNAYSESRNCGERDAVVARLANAYGETRQSIGLAANNAVIEVFASDETGTWTITVTTAGGVTCLIASGQAYEELAEDLIPTSASDA
ncbi:MAG: hypothetical protein KAT26_02350 [Marinosulfonomonas sp.]|nr:hypothetical protein [Marinosulfonomonas sp.]